MAINCKQPYDFEEAQTVREQTGNQVWGCFWCVLRGKKKPFWDADTLRMVGFRAACPEHYVSEGGKE